MAGFCPHCGHQVEIGECPGCGLQITAERILRKAPGRKRTNRLAVWLAVATTAILGLYLAYEYTPWAGSLPTRWLATLQSWGNIKAERALFTRLITGGLPKSETTDALDRLISYRLIDHPPYTHDAPVILAFQPQMSLDGLYTRHWVYLRDVVVLIDGQRQVDQWTYGSSKLDGDNLKFFIKPMQAGQHTITVHCRAILAPHYIYGQTEPPGIYEKRVEIQKVVDIDPRGAGHFFKPVTGSDVLQATRAVTIAYGMNKFEDDNGKESMHRSLYINNQMPRSEPVSGKLYVRPAGKGEFRLLTDLISRKNEVDRLSIEHLPDVAKSTEIDVKIEPDPTMMIYYGHGQGQHYIGETIERRRLSRGGGYVLP